MTYTEQIHQKIISQEILKPCCKKSFLNAFLYSSGTFDLENNVVNLFIKGNDVSQFLDGYIHQTTGKQPKISKRQGRNSYLLTYYSNSAKDFLLRKQKEFYPWNDFKCKDCSRHFLRGIFLSSAYIMDPDKEFRLDISPVFHIDELGSFFESLALNPHETIRLSKKILYFKSSEAISDVFANMGLMDTYFDLQNEYFKKQLNNYTNRQNNCILSNITKSVKAQTELLKLLKKAEELDQIPSLPEDLQETALLRLKYPDYSLSQLSSASVPFISKSGLNHRLKKLELILKEKYD